MARLSEPMRAALEATAESGSLSCVFGHWRPAGERIAWIGDRTVVALVNRGLLREDGRRRIITPEGRAAIGLTAIEGGDDAAS